MVDENKIHYRHLMLFYFRKNTNAVRTTKKICKVYGRAAVSERTVQKWFSRFRSGNINLKDEERSGRPSEIDDDKISILIENNPRHTTREIADILNISQVSVVSHLHKLGMMSTSNVWIPHSLSEDILMDRVLACVSLSKRNENETFLRRLVIGDQKWILYDMVNPKKAMLCIWWNYKGIILLELLSSNQTITSNKYSSQLKQLHTAIIEKQPQLMVNNSNDIILYQDNDKPYVNTMVSEHKIKEFGWETLYYPPFSADMKPSDYHLFPSLQKWLNATTFISFDDLKTKVLNFFNTKPQSFYTDGIFMMPDRWHQIIDGNGKYLIRLIK